MLKANAKTDRICEYKIDLSRRTQICQYLTDFIENVISL